MMTDKICFLQSTKPSSTDQKTQNVRCIFTKRLFMHLSCCANKRKKTDKSSFSLIFSVTFIFIMLQKKSLFVWYFFAVSLFIIKMHSKAWHMHLIFISTYRTSSLFTHSFMTILSCKNCSLENRNHPLITWCFTTRVSSLVTVHSMACLHSRTRSTSQTL